MQCEILLYKYTTEWDVDSFLSDAEFNSHIQPHWPLVTSTMSKVDPNVESVARAAHLSGNTKVRPSVLKPASSNWFNGLVGTYLGIRGPLFNTQAACAGSLYALYTAAMISLDRQTPVVVFCGDNLFDDYSMWTFEKLGALDQQTGYPFDASSNGFRMGAGMAMFVIKHPSVKHPLDAKAVIQNFSFYTNPELFANPGKAEDIIDRLSSSIDYKRIDLWNAHATGTPVGDQVEYNYFLKTCSQDIPIVSFKGHVGHCMSAAGAIEIAMTLDCKKNNQLIPNVIPGNKIVNDDRIITSPTSFTYRRMLKTSLGFGGKIIVAEIDLL
jgi:3-oxoacyl-[acyl-carrier-protein] synthase II